MKIELLSDEAILEASEVNMFLPDGELDPDCGYLRGRKQVAQEQNKYTMMQVVEWGDELCVEHLPLLNNFPRKHCAKCWQELKADIEL